MKRSVDLTRMFAVVLMLGAFAWLHTGCTGCSGPGTENPLDEGVDDALDTDGTDSVDGGGFDVVPNELKPDDIDTKDEKGPDADVKCPYKPPCSLGEVKCKFNNTTMVECIKDPDEVFAQYDDCFIWDSEEVKCGPLQTCKTDVGCACDVAGCEDAGDCEGEADTCKEWSCQEGCCVEVDSEECCKKGSDCMDCINLTTMELLQPCPSPMPEGFVQDKCTQDVCIVASGKCQWTDKVLEGLCDDAEECTIDGCDPLSGDCTYLPSPDIGCVDVPCWGPSQQVADGQCNDESM